VQTGDTAAENICCLLHGEEPAAFRHRDPGSLATIGRNAAISYVQGLSLSGLPARVAWLAVHLIPLIGFH
jgi:NADH dehydrogenase